MLSACQSVYLHDPERATATADLKTKFDKLAAPAFFDAQEKNLADLAGREDRALAGLLVASRNYRLLNVIAPATGSAERTTQARLRNLVEIGLDETYGLPRLDTAQLKVATSAPFIERTAQRNIAFLREGVADRAQAYQGAGGQEKVDCPSVVAAPSSADPLYNELASACRMLLTAIAGNCTLGASEGKLLHRLCLEGAALRNVASQKDRTKELAAAKKALEEAMKAKPSDDEADIARANDMIEKAKALPEDERLKTILSHVETVFGEELEATISELVADADSKVGKASEPMSKALFLIGAVQNVQALSDKPAGEYASALLIGLAKIRHDINIVELDIAARQLDADIVDRQTAALRNQIYYLAQAQAALDGHAKDPDRAEAEAMTFYVRSLDAGRNPYELLTFRRSQLLRSTALKRARITEEDYRKLIQPAIDQIAAYGAGGIKPETIAEILSGLPVAGSILAE
jgi:hypothetical protein